MINKFEISDIYEGQQYEFRKVFSTAVVESFSELTKDFHPLHTSSEYAKSNGFDNIIVQGLLLSSFISYVVGMKLPGENALILSQDAKYIKPIYVNEEVTYNCEVTKLDTRFSTFVLLYTIFNQAGLKAVSGNVLVKVRSPKLNKI